MLEAKLADAVILKRLLDSIKELVTDANFECNEEGLKLQAMDNSHVALVAVLLQADGFVKYRCDRPMPLGVNLGSLTKVLKCAKDDDVCTLKATDDADVLNLTYEGKNSDRIAEYDMKLMDIDADTLGIPDTEYDARVTMPSSEFARIVRDLAQLGESVRIDVSKEGVRFAADGEAANGSVLLKQTDAARRKYADYGNERDAKKEDDEDGDGDEDDQEGNGDQDMEDVEEEDGGEFKARSEDEGEGEEERDGAAAVDSDEEGEGSRKRKKAQKATKAKRAKKSDDDGPAGGVAIDLASHVALTFSLKYLVNFAKSSTLSDTVQLMMSNDVPLLVSYDFGPGHIHYYLAPKIGDE
ncbi:hypothetical protein EW145_g6663 [Phellinidium pouzarii]|uniref:DNA sliding clamp PCNA n=1 Tax=Phellinidium pouzarii TaxID=167371 RepID=A0A4S4L0M7_9AGAM|nr:hypothetical protein EW145_g6663 [Phellinidium pouzarii]